MSNNDDSKLTEVKDYVKQNLPFLAAEYDGRRATLRRNPNYQETLMSVKKAFNALRNIPSNEIVLCAPFLEFNDILQVTEELWPDLLPRLMLVRVMLDRPPQPARSYEGMKVHIQTKTGKITTLEVSPEHTISDVKAMIQEKDGALAKDQRLTLDGEELSWDYWTLADYDVRNEATINLTCELRFGKPVIYLFPPTPIADIQVQLSLVNSWRFSVVYPPTAICTNTASALHQSIAWTVDAKPDGTLFDHKTERELAYLFWEAQTNPKLPLSPACSRPGSPTAVSDPSSAHIFDPSDPIIDPSNSVLLPLDKVTNYIDDALLALGLHTEARTSFITYWLPDLQKHTFIALRFVPQAEYEPAAPMVVTPVPEVMTRVFMLFRGVDDSGIEGWQSAAAKAQEDVTIWRDVVGIDIRKASNQSLFRALEWGGMEVV